MPPPAKVGWEVGGQRLGHDLFLNWDQKEHKHTTAKNPVTAKDSPKVYGLTGMAQESVGVALESLSMGWTG